MGMASFNRQRRLQKEKQKAKESKESNEPNEPTLAELKKLASDLGIDVPKKITKVLLQKMIDEHREDNPEGEGEADGTVNTGTDGEDNPEGEGQTGDGTE